MQHAITTLQVALDTLTTNEPINRAEGNVEQADHEAAAAEEIRKAIDLLAVQGTKDVLAACDAAMAKMPNPTDLQKDLHKAAHLVGSVVLDEPACPDQAGCEREGCNQNLDGSLCDRATQPGTAPKITPADIEAQIKSEHYFTAAQGVAGAPYQKGQAAKTEAAEQRAQQVSVADVAFDLARVQVELAREQVRELRLQNDGQELLNEQQRKPAFNHLAHEALPEVPGMPPHQVRMRFERDELSAKLSKLVDFVKTKAFADLSQHEQELMHEQREAMQRYLVCLQDRIALFKQAQDNA